ncbi:MULTISPECIES: hypothetical protein [Acinetobacter]|uniref:hypothetical protein n=1 Tax=Acinetobacter TaxID=469 RepID=UPI001F368354|nr:MULTISPECIES: hypothetical protein [Acinetobacter]MCL5769640.1 hypothetical protein [Acinetobacter sp. ANC5681]UIP24317.1 hypothetical protein LZG54_09115 [Acinetobacter towneri]
MKLLSYYKDKDSNEFGLRVLSLEYSAELEDQMNEFEPQVLVAELESENLRVIKLAEKNWYGFGLYQPKDEIIGDLEKLKDIPKVIFLSTNSDLKSKWKENGCLVCTDEEYYKECRNMLFNSLL